MSSNQVTCPRHYKIVGNNKLDNLYSNDQISSITDTLPGQLILIISKSLFLELGFSYSLYILPSNSNSKKVYNHIYLLLLLNQLQ